MNQRLGIRDDLHATLARRLRHWWAMKPLKTPDAAAAGRNRLLRDIAVVLVVKLVALGALWLAFFSERPALSAADVGRALLERTAAAPRSAPGGPR